MTTFTKRDVCLWPSHLKGVVEFTPGQKLSLTFSEVGTVEFSPMNGGVGFKPTGGDGLEAWKKVPYGTVLTLGAGAASVEDDEETRALLKQIEDAKKAKLEAEQKQRSAERKAKLLEEAAALGIKVG